MEEILENSEDRKTADAFAESWNNLPLGSIYTGEQFIDWLEPITQKEIEGKKVLELGCGNASLMVYMAGWQPSYLEGVDLGDSVDSAVRNMSPLSFKNWRITQADLTDFESEGFDFVFCIGVLHHLKNPKSGLDSIIRNTKAGGRFHCWVYAFEGNGLIIYFVDPLRKVVSRFPWWLTKYFIATPLSVPFFLYAKFVYFFRDIDWFKNLPLYRYCLWIAKREFIFFRHVAFDQLVTPMTQYISKMTIEKWLKDYNQIDQNSIYINMRNGNSWKFGGRLKN